MLKLRCHISRHSANCDIIFSDIVVFLCHIFGYCVDTLPFPDIVTHDNLAPGIRLGPDEAMRPNPTSTSLALGIILLVTLVFDFQI